MNIVLIGMRGSGKTTAGKILARKLGGELVEMDELITRKAGLSIPEIVKKYGWEKFRDIEEEITNEVAKRDNIVNAAGGGVVTREKNIAKLKENGVLVWLKAGVETLLERTQEDSQRPPLVKGKTRREEVEITLAGRKPLYQKAADLVIDTENKTPEEVAGDIIKSLKQICCLIGDPVEHSLSPLIHNVGYQALGINYLYVPFRVKDFKQAIEGIRRLDIRGASITMPHKARAIEYVDEFDRVAIETGAVNTIVNNDGILTGYNTDYHGALKALEEATSLEGKKAVLVGSGGAATAIALGLRRGGAKLVILNRTEAKAKRLAEMFDAEDFGGLKKLGEVSSADILINATPAGMWPKTSESIIPQNLLHNKLTVFDTVYNPKETKLLIEARERGCAIVYGYKMFLYQAALQFELFTGREAPLKVMESTLTQALEGGKNATHFDRR
jgi:shikimate dehydrogenase